MQVDRGDQWPQDSRVIYQRYSNLEQQGELAAARPQQLICRQIRGKEWSSRCRLINESAER